MLVIRADLVEKIMAHARQEQLDEACGIIAGPEGADRPERHIPMVNAAKHSQKPIIVRGRERSARTYYDFVVGEKLAVYRTMDYRDEWPVVIYHSHTHTPAYPSDVDVDFASGPLSDPRIHHVIVSTRENPAPTVRGYELRSYRIVDGVVTEEQVEVVETYMFAHTGADVIPDQQTSPDRD